MNATKPTYDECLAQMIAAGIDEHQAKMVRNRIFRDGYEPTQEVLTANIEKVLVAKANPKPSGLARGQYRILTTGDE